MKIFRSHKSLFAKMVILGVVLALLSGLMLQIMRSNHQDRIRQLAIRESLESLAWLRTMARLYCDEATSQAASGMEQYIDSGLDISDALARVERKLEQVGMDVAIWCDGQDGLLHSNNKISIEPDSLLWIFEGRPDTSADPVKAIGGRLLIFSRKSIQIENALVAEPAIFLAFPLDLVYNRVDRDRSIESIYAVPGAKDIEDADKTSRFPVLDVGGNPVGSIAIRHKAPDRETDVAGWEMWGMAILPLFCLLAVSLLLYRYFESLAGQFAAIKRAIKQEKPGTEIFRRDRHDSRKALTELTDIFDLIEEGQGENARLLRSFDLMSASLNFVKEKGYSSDAVHSILEVVTNFSGASGGLVLAIESNEDRIEPIGQSGLADEVVTGICLTPSGRSFINNCIRQGAGLRHFDIVAESAVQPSLEIFSGFKHVYCMPLYFKAQPVGVMIFLNDEPEPNWRLHVSLGPLLADLLGAIIYGLGNEKEKAARYDKARILQETSLAISSTLDLPSVLQVVATRLTDYAGATYCTIILNSDAENVMEVATFHTRRQGGAHPPEARRINLVEFPRLAEAMSANRIMILGAQEMGELTPSEKRFLKIDAIKQLLIVPVSHSAKSIGVVVLGEERAKSRSSVGSDRLNFVQAVISQAASAIENARLYGYINQRVDQLTALYSVSAAIHSEINVNTMLEKVLATTGEFLHYTSAAIFPVDENHKIQNPMAASGVDQEQSTDGMLTVFSATAAQVVASTGGSLIVEDMRVESDFHPTFHKTLSELSVPIKIAERVIGVFSVGSNRAWVYSAADESFLKALAGQIAVALERARLFEQERERSLKLRTIFEFSKKLSKSLNVSEVLKIAATSIREAFAYQLVAVFMADEKAGRFIIGHQSSATDKKLPDDFFVPLDEGLLGRALRSRKTVYSPNVTSEPDYVVAVGDVRSEICIPIMVADRVMGVLDVESMELDTFSQEDIDTLEAMADIMSVAIDNSFLFEETIEKAERLSLIDNINRAISATLDLDSFFRVVARAVADNAGYRWTALAVPEDGAFVFKAGYSPKSAGIISTENMLFMLQSHLETVIRTARPEFVTFSQMANSGAREKLHSIIDAGIRSLAIFPIGDSTRAEAVMIVGSACSDGFREQEVTLLKDLAVHLRIAWQNAQLYMELRTAYEQLQEAQDRVIQTEKLRALGEMSSGVVHDFNNVLAAILGRLQIVLRKLSDFGDWSGTQFIRRNLELMEKAANDGSHILSRINEFTKKKPSEKFVDLHVDQIIADTIELTRPRWHDQARLAGKSIEVDFHHFGHQVTAGSPPELREVFTNLIINAVDAIEGVGKITITSSGRPGETIIITVEDTGRGMTAETRNKIFEPFFTTKGAGGTGLGLSVTYGIISRHKGSIDVETELGRGTKFIITLPVREAGQEETRHVKIDASNVTCGRILIVDDEDQFRDIISEILTSAGHTVHSAANGRQALEMMTQKEYDVVITDLGMAGLSGWELADAIHRDHPSARIIIATGWGANLDRESLTAHHIHGLINKPFKIEELIGAVDEALGGVKKGAPVGWK